MKSNEFLTKASIRHKPTFPHEFPVGHSPNELTRWNTSKLFLRADTKWNSDSSIRLSTVKMVITMKIMPVIFNFLFRYVVLGRFCNFLSGLVVAGVSWSRYPSYQKKKVLISQFCFISFFNWFTKSQTLDVCGLKWTREKALAKFWLPNFSSKLTEFGIAIMARRTTAHFTGKLGQQPTLQEN